MKRRTFLLSLLALGCAAAVFSQSNPLNDLFNTISGGKAPTKTQTDTLTAVGQAFKSAQGIGPEETQRIGEALALEIVARYGGLVKDPAVSRRVNLLGRAMARYSDLPNAHWRFGVLNSDTVNGFSAPDGWVFISRGLYNLARNDDALAGVLAHEIAHVSRHHAEAVLKTAELGAAAGNFLVARSGDARSLQAALQGLNQDVSRLTSTLFQNGYGKDTEYEADRVGHELARTCGYAGGGLRSVLVVLQQRTGDAKQAFPTHPPLPERIRRLPDEPAPKL